MSSIALGRGDVLVGVDTHKNEHVAVALDGLGGLLHELAIAANPDGYAQLLAWADELGAVAAFGVEGTGSYGSGLARFLRRHGRKVVEVRGRRAKASGACPARATRSTPSTPPGKCWPAGRRPHPSSQMGSWRRSAWSRSPATPLSGRTPRR